MEPRKRSLKRLAAAGVLAVVVVGAGFALEPVTRGLVARDELCFYCHLEFEYKPTRLVSNGAPHPVERGGAPARCVDCHLPRGFVPALDAWAHFASATDLFGHFRDREAERAGDWIPPKAAMAYRVRDRLYEADSITCRGCHDLERIKPRSARGRHAHQQARERDRTCIECHFNLFHHVVAVRPGAFGGAPQAVEELEQIDAVIDALAPAGPKAPGAGVTGKGGASDGHQS